MLLTIIVGYLTAGIAYWMIMLVGLAIECNGNVRLMFNKDWLEAGILQKVRDVVISIIGWPYYVILILEFLVDVYKEHHNKTES